MPAVEILALDWECHEAPVQASKLLEAIPSAPEFGYVQVLRLNPEPTTYRIRASLVDKLWTAAEHLRGSSLGGQMKLVPVGNNLKSGINAGLTMPLEDRFLKQKHDINQEPRGLHSPTTATSMQEQFFAVFVIQLQSTGNAVNEETFQIPYAPTTTCTTASAPSRIEVAYRFLKHLGEEMLAFRMQNGLAIFSSSARVSGAIQTFFGSGNGITGQCETSHSFM